ncbi:MAG: cytochrome c, partial [Planctomycetota bacterium]
VASDAAPASASAETRGLFATFCAACHGATGDGNGTTKLDRPARSFKDGGFSYGNTPDAIAKTLAYGIPGSVMPSFGTSLSEEQRIALAKYVIELGPQDMPTESPDRVMVVSDRALVARGKLPPIVEGGEEIPRGLLVGTPDGFTFAYRTDDLRLIAVYQGEFAERTDWMGRGGTQLKPLGKLVASFGRGTPEQSFFVRDEYGMGVRCTARFLGSRVLGSDAAVEFELAPARGATTKPVARVAETMRPASSSVGSGWRRRLVVENLTDAVLGIENVTALDVQLVKDRKNVESVPDSAMSMRRLIEGGGSVVDAWWSPVAGEGDGAGEAGYHFDFVVAPHSTREVNTLTLLVPVWNDDIAKRWSDEVKSMTSGGVR